MQIVSHFQFLFLSFFIQCKINELEENRKRSTSPKTSNSSKVDVQIYVFIGIIGLLSNNGKLIGALLTYRVAV